MLSAWHVAVSVVAYPTAHVTDMPEPVSDWTTEGVEPLAAAVAGQGSSTQVGSVHELSALQVAVPEVE